MTRRAPIPFDPDALSQGVHVHAAPQGAAMLSELVESHDWHGAGNDDDHKGLSKPLSNHQKWKLSELAESVYAFLRDQGLLKGEDATAYRHRIAVKACGKRISQAAHGDFKLIQAALLHERGQAEAARRALAQAAATPAVIAMHALMKLCRETGTPTHAAGTMAARFYSGAELQDLTARQLWSIFYTVRNNANAKAGVGSKANRFKSKRRKSA
jgi:hypothetical protein